MSQKSDGSSSSFTSSTRWKTDFKELDDTYIRPTHDIDDIIILSPSNSSSVDDENPLKEMKSLKNAASDTELGEPVNYPEDDLDQIPTSSLPLDVNTPNIYEQELDIQPEQEPEEPILLEPATTCDIPISVTKAIDDVSPSSEQGKTLGTPSSLTSQISTDLSLAKIEEGPVIIDHELLEDSLALFTDVKKKSSPRVPPPRPPKPKITATAEVHPLMQVLEPDPEPDFMSEPPPSRPKLSEKLVSKTAGILKKKGKPQGPLSEEPDTNPPEVIPPEPATSERNSAEKDSISITSSDSYTSSQTKKQKFKAIRNSLYSKAYSKYNQYYDYYTAEKKKPIKDQELEKPPSESGSEGGFYEITAEDVSNIPETPIMEYGSSDQESEEQSAQLNDSSDLQDSSNEEVAPEVTQTATPARLTETAKPGFSVHYQNHIIVSGAVCLFSVFLYITVFYFNSFCQGFVTGAIFPLSLGSLIFYLSRPEKEDKVKAVKNLLAAKRLRKLGSGASIKDFFQYTETHNFGEIRILKNIPYRYFKLKGPLIQCFELNATKEQVPDPLKLTENEIKSYGLKLVFKEDISGWLVSVEAPPGSKVTSSNMWKKRYPIWVRKKTWRTEVDEYGSGDHVSSFYLFSPYSRYKEHWYEALKRAVVVSDCADCTDLATGTYKEFMGTLFSQIPNVDTKLPDSTDNTDEVPRSISANSAWINALFGRFVWNIFNDKKWEDRIKERIVRKLSSVKTKHISSLELKSFDLGNTVPLITKTYLPKIDHQGVWSEMQFDYCGEVSLSLVAKLNSKPTTVGESSKSFETMKLETGSASSTAPSSSPGRLSRFYKILDKIEIGVSAKVTKVAGRLCVNIPPPPTDCLWYGFREAPELKIHLTPILGKWISLDYRPITNALNKQLQTLFNDTFVLPAMENIVMPGMSRGMTAVKQDLPDTLDINQLLPQPIEIRLRLQGEEDIESPQELLDVAGGDSRGTSPTVSVP